jgi:hypothetical protein
MYLENRLIAMLDVLGMSNKIENKSNLPAILEKYKDLITKAQTEIIDQQTIIGSKDDNVSNFQIGEFVFDTIVLVSHPLNPKNTSQFILSTIRLMEVFAKEDMPLRGAIGIGDYCVDNDTKIFLSDIFKRLNNEESMQQWTGCVLIPEAEEQIISSLIGTKPTEANQSDVLHRLSIPTKSTSDECRWCLNWSYKLTASEVEAILQYMKDSPAKHKNTQEYIKYLKTLPDAYSMLPPEFYPAVKLKTIKTRGSASIQFVDENELPTDPGCSEWILTFQK